MRITLFFSIFWILTTINSHAQDDDNHRTFDKVICEYTIPIERNGLTTSSFWVQSRIRIERWENTSKIILDITAEQSSASNPDPNFIYSYNYNGKAYGNETLGFELFNTIGTSRSGLTFEVLVTYGSQSWGWMKVDGMTNQFGPIEKDAKASDVFVRAKIVGVGSFSGTAAIEQAIKKTKNTDNDINVKGTSTSPAGSDPSKNNGVKENVAEKKAANATKNTNDKIVAKKEEDTKTINMPTVESSLEKSTLHFDGSAIYGEAECYDNNSFSFISDENFVLFGQNISEGTTIVNSDFYAMGCSDCPAMQFQDLKKETIYIATNGTIIKKGNRISLNLVLTNLLDILDNNAQKRKITATLTCDN
jgi:hypothetical protein